MWDHLIAFETVPNLAGHPWVEDRVAGCASGASVAESAPANQGV